MTPGDELTALREGAVMAAKEYSRRLGSIDDGQLRSALERLGLGELVSAEPVVGGLFGQNVFVTSTTGEYVLRGAPHYDWQLPAERFFARQLHERTRAPVPWPYLLDPGDDIFGWSYAVMPRMPGLRLSDRAATEGLTGDERLGMARSMGENLTLLHALSWPHPGRYDLATDTIAPLEESWTEWVAAEARRWLSPARRHSDLTTDADVDWVEGILRSSCGALCEPFEPHFVMHDYGEHNVTFEQQDGHWRVSGVFDLMEAFFGDGEMDLSRQTALYLEEDPELARTFLRTYLELLPPRPGFSERFPAYMLLDRLVVWEYAQRHRQWLNRHLTLREWAEPYIASCAT
ncbi:MAG TPA: aminoglycoside phosphotransferase family protein [Rubrobacter sp.]|nr:aminoglycoside phosphotransferase family protein [Rubrobacter sp.]